MNKTKMDEKKKEIMKILAEEIDHYDPFDLGVLVGTAEANRKRREVEEHEKQAANM